MNLKENLQFIREDIENILIKSGRPSDDVELIAVTKTVGTEIIKESIDLGIKNIGENRVQELERKMDEIGNKVNYHMIGHLQSNKVKYIIDRVHLIHSLDRISLAKELDKRSSTNNSIANVLIQVNVAEEESKFGLKVSEVLPFIEKVLEFENIRIKGLMTIAPYTDDEILLRNIFRTMFKLKEDIVGRKYDNLTMDYLSMGMTNDYKIAIEEGSNMVRVGSGIFGKRNY
ncbi:YggS family pyridoxal phosphate-dependent enzyme [Lachnospiraceae bacterium NSJ-29]|uniref:Pyridoxal phosphate homeostasis protein n=1 Tax=Wansuia hejianensis TaxID=2763667 RepID=A0A926EY07_9FIRM|nr:YggS family pyridoxal phosphate-dependent enzyme [Wansuia hejianensis]